MNVIEQGSNSVRLICPECGSEERIVVSIEPVLTIRHGVRFITGEVSGMTGHTHRCAVPDSKGEQP